MNPFEFVFFGTLAAILLGTVAAIVGAFGPRNSRRHPRLFEFCLDLTVYGVTLVTVSVAFFALFILFCMLLITLA